MSGVNSTTADNVSVSLVDRVRRTALKLAHALKNDSNAASKGFTEPDLLLVELVALFHDMADGKLRPCTVFHCSMMLQANFSVLTSKICRHILS